MFTGLIEALGRVAQVECSTEGAVLTVDAPEVSPTLRLGDSIAVDGVCTTIVVHTANQAGFVIQASPETLSKTTFSHLAPGMAVNLERPLRPSDRLGGHFVTGHVDGLATLTHSAPEGLSQVMTFLLADPTLSAYLVPKGSVAVNGVSLTVNRVIDQGFCVAIIPHTLHQTTFGQLRPGDRVNLETDLLGKYVHRLLADSDGLEKRAMALVT